MESVKHPLLQRRTSLATDRMLYTMGGERLIYSNDSTYLTFRENLQSSATTTVVMFVIFYCLFGDYQNAL